MGTTCVAIGGHCWMDPVLGLIFSCYCLGILNTFEQGISQFYFVLGPLCYKDGPALLQHMEAQKL